MDIQHQKFGEIVIKKLLKLFMLFLLGIFTIGAVIYGSLAGTKGEPATPRAFFENKNPRPLIIAHRGGAGLWAENTLYAFERVAALGVDVIELDVHDTADGKMVVIHDATVDRTTNGVGRVSEMTLEQIKKLDAGYRWTPDGGKTFPLRGKGITVPTLQEVFKTFPKMKFNIEPKPGNASLAKPLCNIIRENQMSERTVVGSFKQAIIDEFRAECAEVATSAGPSEVSKFLAMYKVGLGESYSPAMQALQIPEFAGVSKEFVKAAHERNLQVHVWTINEAADMQRLLEMGVDGIMTDYPDRLINLLKQTVKR